MVSTGGLEPPRVASHAPQTCAYTDSATSTQVFIRYLVVNFCLVSLWRRCSLSFTPSILTWHLVNLKRSPCHIDTSIIRYLIVNFCLVSLWQRCSASLLIPLKKRYLIVFFGRVPRRHLIIYSVFNKNYIITNIIFRKEFADEGTRLEL